MKKVVLLVVTIFAVAAMFGCASTPAAPAHGDMKDIILVPDKAELALNESVEIMAKAIDDKGVAFDLPADVALAWVAVKLGPLTVTPAAGAKVTVKAVKAIGKAGSLVTATATLKDKKVLVKKLTVMAKKAEVKKVEVKKAEPKKDVKK